VNIDSRAQHLFSGLPSSQKIGRETNPAHEAPSTTSPTATFGVTSHSLRNARDLTQALRALGCASAQR